MTLVLVGCGSGSDSDHTTHSADTTAQDPASLYGRTFAATKATDNGSPVRLLAVSPVVLYFAKEDHGLTWESGCNGAGSTPARITREKLVIPPRSTYSTAVGCPGPREEQESWFAGFLFSGPTWELSGGKLSLSNAKTTIEFAERPTPTKAETSGAQRATTSTPVRRDTGQVYEANCGNNSYLEYKPSDWSSGCTGGSAKVRHINWRFWGSDGAQGEGRALVVDCDPTCATGTLYRTRGKIELSGVKTCRRGGRTYRYFARAEHSIYVRADNPLGRPAGWETGTYKAVDGMCRVISR
jgi:heat shock protein HslJ